MRRRTRTKDSISLDKIKDVKEVTNKSFGSPEWIRGLSDSPWLSGVTVFSFIHCFQLLDWKVEGRPICSHPEKVEEENNDGTRFTRPSPERSVYVSGFQRCLFASQPS